MGPRPGDTSSGRTAECDGTTAPCQGRGAGGTHTPQPKLAEPFQSWRTSNFFSVFVWDEWMLWSCDWQPALKITSRKGRGGGNEGRSRAAVKGSKEEVFAGLQPLMVVLALAGTSHMTAHVHPADGGEQTAAPAVRAHPLGWTQLFGRSTWRERRACARSGLTLRLAAAAA